MEKIRQWYFKNQTQITWFIVGFLTLSGLESLSHGDYLNAGISFVLIGLNISLNK